MSMPDVPRDSILFSLYPCNDDAANIVRGNEKYIDSYKDTDCISVKINHESRHRGRLLSFGHSEYRNDIILSDTAYSLKFFFTYSKDGELILEDESATGNIELQWHGDKGVVEKHSLKGYPRRRAIPFAKPKRIKLTIAEKAVFDFVWRRELAPAHVVSLRASLADMYELIYWENKPLLETPEAALIEEKCRYTPKVPYAYEKKNNVEVYNYGEIGRGGFGTVYQVVDLAVGRLLAMKVAKKRTDATRCRRDKWKIPFKEEVQTLASLQHPNIAGFVHSQGWTEGLPVQLFFELYYGSARDYFLPSHSCTGFLPAPNRISIQLAYLIDHVLSALHFLHSRGYVHRDVKPENVLYQIRGYKKRPFFVLSDFGLVTQRPPTDGSVAGSVDYMAPETARYGEHTPAADIYAFGLSVLELMGITCVGERKADVEVWRDKLDENGIDDGEDYEDFEEDPPLAYPECEPSHSRIQSLLHYDLVDSCFQTILHIDPAARVSAMKTRENMVYKEVTEARMLYSKDASREEVSFGLGKLQELREQIQQRAASAVRRGGPFVHMQHYQEPHFARRLGTPQYTPIVIPPPMPPPMPPPQFAGPSMHAAYAAPPMAYPFPPQPMPQHYAAPPMQPQYESPAISQQYANPPMPRQLLTMNRGHTLPAPAAPQPPAVDGYPPRWEANRPPQQR